MTLFETIPQTEIIRALWLKQPFASLMLHGKIETRTYPTKVRGKVLLCSCKQPFDYKKVIEISREQVGRINDALQVHYSTLPLGVAICVANLVSCHPMRLLNEDKCFVKFHEPWVEVRTKKKFSKTTGKWELVEEKIIKRLWCWIFDDVQAVEPFELDGKQGWAILDEETKDKIITI